MPSGMNVFLVDDEEELVELYEMKLEDQGHNVSTAFDGKSAIEVLKSKDFDLVLCDINMPNGNGLEVYRNFKELGKKASFAFITGHAKGSPELNEAEKTGAIVFNKPVKWPEIWSLIDKIKDKSISMPKAQAPNPEKASEQIPNVSAEPVKISSSLEQKGMDLIRSINNRKK
ncbi:MAG: response regulator [Bdellovibrionota bacterium]|nr:response regulator [Bdellovibrionota bacterium]